MLSRPRDSPGRISACTPWSTRSNTAGARTRWRRAFSLSSRKTRSATRRGRRSRGRRKRCSARFTQRKRPLIFKLSELVSFPTSLVTLRAVETRVIITQRKNTRRKGAFVRHVSRLRRLPIRRRTRFLLNGNEFASRATPRLVVVRQAALPFSIATPLDTRSTRRLGRWGSSAQSQ